MAKTKLDEALIINMSDKLRDGLPIGYTCDYFGVTRQSYLNWMEQGEKDYEADLDTIYSRFFDEIKKARAQYIEKAKNTIHMLPKNWQAVAWWLERTDRNFMPKQMIEANGEDGKVTVVLGGKIKEASKNLLEQKTDDNK